MAIHNYIKRTTSTDVEFSHYEHEYILRGDYDDHVILDPFPNTNIVSSLGMNNVWETIRNQIVIHIHNY